MRQLIIMLMVAIDVFIVIYMLYCIKKGVRDGVKTRDAKWLMSVIGKKTYYWLIAYGVFQFACISIYKFIT